MTTDEPTGIELRRAGPDDSAAVGRLLLASGLAGDAGTLPRGALFVAAASDAIVGVAALEPFGGDALLRSACIAEEWRGQGVGTALLEHVLTDAALDALDSVYLLTTSAAGFFARFGFREVGTHELPDPLARAIARDGARDTGAFVMQLRLAAP